jgi:nicotinamide riboside transporter PnuC
MDWIAAGLMLFGNAIIITRKHWIAFVIFLIANTIYAYYWLINQQWATLILCSFFIGQNIWGIISWYRESKNTEDNRIEDCNHWFDDE